MFATLKFMQSDCCEVCRNSRYDNNIFQRIKCKSCNKIVHKFCYAPDLRDTKHFKCDECKKGQECVCSICHLKNGILKQVNSHQWVHVLCGLFSEHVRVKNFRTLTFKPTLKQFSKDIPKQVCEICKKSKGQLAECVGEDCKNHAHIGCVLGHVFQSGMEYQLTYQFLDKHHLGLFSNLLEHQDQFLCTKYIKSAKHKTIMCHDHNDDPYFVHCICGMSKLKKKQQNNDNQIDLDQQSSSPEIPVDQVNCNRCGRWYHMECCKFQKSRKDEDFICTGCKENDLFRKAALLPEIIQKLVEIEMTGKMDHKSMKFLDSIIFNTSKSIISFCTRESYFVDKYYLRKVLERFTKRGKKMKNLDQKIIEIVYILVNKKHKPYIKMTPQDFLILLNQFEQKKGFNLTESTCARCKTAFQKKINESQKLGSSIANKSDSSSSFIKMKRPHRPKMVTPQTPPAQHQEIIIPSASPEQQEQVQVVIVQEHSMIPEERQQDIQFALNNDNNIMVPEMQPGSLIESISERKQDKVDIITKGNAFIQDTSVSIVLTEKQLAKLARKFIKYLQNDEYAVTWIHQLSSRLSPNIFEVLFESNLRTNEITILFTRFKEAIRDLSIDNKLPWKEKGFETLSTIKKNQISAFLMNQIEKKESIGQNESKEDTISRAIKKILFSVFSPHDRLIRDNIINQAIFLASVDEATYTEYISLYCCNKCLQQNQKLPDLSEINQGIERLRDNLMIKTEQLDEDEYIEFMGYINRSRFYLNIVTYYFKDGKEGRIQIVNPYQFQTFGGYPQLLKYVQKAISNWIKTEQSTEYLFRLYIQTPFWKMNLNKQQKKIIVDFACKNLMRAIRNYQDYPGRMNSVLLKQICDFIRQIGKQNQFPQLLKFQEEYNLWKQRLNELINIEQMLQTLDGSRSIYNLVESALNRAKYFQLDMICEIRKLKTIRCWAVLSIKILEFINFKNMGLTCIQILTINQCMKSVHYPQNSLSFHIETLLNEVQQLLPQVQRLTKRYKFKNQQLYQELMIIHQKPQIKDGLQLVKILQTSKINWMKEIDDIERYIMQGQDIYKEFKEKSQQQSMMPETLERLRITMVENPFNTNQENIFDEIYRNLYHSKSRIEKIQISRADYNRMLTYAGKDLFKFCKRTTPLRQAYKKIDAAKKQTLKDEPNQQILLKNRDPEIKKDIQCDRQMIEELNNLTRKSAEIAEKLYKLQTNNGYWEDYEELLKEIRRHPVALPKSMTQIMNMKGTINDLLEKIRTILRDPKQNLDSQEWSTILETYSNNKMKHKQMEEFVKIHKNAKLINCLAKDHSIRNYEEFISKCDEFQSLSENEKILKIRVSYLISLFTSYTNKKPIHNKDKERMLNEASFLCYKISKNSPNYQQLVTILAALSQKLYGSVKIPSQKHKGSTKDISPRPSSNKFVEKVEITKKVIKVRMPSDDSQDKGTYEVLHKSLKKDKESDEESYQQ